MSQTDLPKFDGSDARVTEFDCDVFDIYIRTEYGAVEGEDMTPWAKGYRCRKYCIHADNDIDDDARVNDPNAGAVQQQNYKLYQEAVFGPQRERELPRLRLDLIELLLNDNRCVQLPTILLLQEYIARGNSGFNNNSQTFAIDYLLNGGQFYKPDYNSVPVLCVDANERTINRYYGHYGQPEDQQIYLATLTPAILAKFPIRFNA